MFHSFGGGFPFPGMDGGFEIPTQRGPAKDVDTTKFYKVLELEKDCSTSEIKSQYKKLCRKYHPDKPGGDEEKFKGLKKAYEVLSNDEQRQVYDRYGEEGLEDGGGGPRGGEDLMSSLFGGGRGGGRPQKRKGKDVTHSMDVSLEHMYNGYMKKLAVTRTVIDKSKGVETCGTCGGSGSIKIKKVMGSMMQIMQSPCTNRDCNGGRVCTRKKEKEVLEVFVEKGSPDSHKIVFYGKADEQPDVETGNIVFVLNTTPHPIFTRKNADLFVKKTITLGQALTGFEFELTHLDGRKLLIRSAAGDIIKNKGLEPEWEVYKDCDVSEDSVAKCQLTKEERLKEFCEKEDFTGFVLDKNAEACFFKKCAYEEYADKKTTAKGKTLYVRPSGSKLQAYRTMKCVKNEGMPLYKNTMCRGNLFIDITIEFPDSLDSNAITQLRKIFDVPALKENAEEDIAIDEVCTLEDVDPVQSEKLNAKQYEDEEDDDDDGHHHGGQGVQCAQQ